jgi:hypothetical protein
MPCFRRSFCLPRLNIAPFSGASMTNALVISPDGASTVVSSGRRIDNTMIKALARVFRWRKLLETGVFATVEEISDDEKINASYIGRVLRLTLLSPNIVEAILDGR